MRGLVYAPLMSHLRRSTPPKRLKLLARLNEIAAFDQIAKSHQHRAIIVRPPFLVVYLATAGKGAGSPPGGAMQQDHKRRFDTLTTVLFALRECQSTSEFC